MSHSTISGSGPRIPVVSTDLVDSAHQAEATQQTQAAGSTSPVDTTERTGGSGATQQAERLPGADGTRASKDAEAVLVRDGKRPSAVLAAALAQIEINSPTEAAAVRDVLAKHGITINKLIAASGDEDFGTRRALMEKYRSPDNEADMARSFKR